MHQVVVDVVEAVPVKKEIGKAFKGDAKDIMDALAKMSLEEVDRLEASLKTDGYVRHKMIQMRWRSGPLYKMCKRAIPVFIYAYRVGRVQANGKSIDLPPTMVEIKRSEKTVYSMSHNDHVIWFFVGIS